MVDTSHAALHDNGTMHGTNSATYLTLRGRIKRAGSHCIRATATGAMYFPLMFDTCPGPGHVYPFDV